MMYEAAQPLPKRRAEALELIRIYRDSAHRYFSLRTNATYLNLTAAGVVTVVMGGGLLDLSKECLPQFLDDHILEYLLACTFLCGFAGWATAMVNALTNSITRYLAMASDLETHVFGVDYGPYRKSEFGVTAEFFPDLAAELKVRFSGSIWNTINASVAAYASVLGAAIGFNMADHRAGQIVYVVSVLAYLSVVMLLLYFSISARDRTSRVFKSSIGKGILALAFVIPFAILFWGEWYFDGVSPWTIKSVPLCQVSVTVSHDKLGRRTN
jgi:hypothetical protein